MAEDLFAGNKGEGTPTLPLFLEAPMDTENKSYWVQKGRQEEDIFCEEIAPLYGLEVSINPNKKEDPYDHDLVMVKDGETQPAELKSVKTPFFKALKLAGIPAERCVTFNHKDYIRYMSKYFYKELYIFFWVYWEESTMGDITVSKTDGLWISSIHHIDNLITSRKTGYHKYLKRANLKDSNAKTSHMLRLDDLHEFKKQRLN